MLKEIAEFIVFLILLGIFLGIVYHKELEKHGMKPYYDEAKCHLHDLWYGK